MLSVSAAWFVLKRAPRVIALTLNLITIFLLIFLVVGCRNTSQMSTFLTRYEFNSNSIFYNTLKSSYQRNVKTQGLENIIIRSGYMGVCLDHIPTNYGIQNTTDTTVCYPRKKVQKSSLYQDLTIELFNMHGNSTVKDPDPVKLNILHMAQVTSTKLVHPYILEASIALTILMFIVLIYVIIPGVPLKSMVNAFLLGISPILVILWGMGAMWQHVSIHASESLVPLASMDILKVHNGKKAATMGWFAFSFLLCDCLILWLLYFRDRKNLDDEIEKVTSEKSHPQPHNYNLSDSSTLNYRV